MSKTIIAKLRDGIENVKETRIGEVAVGLKALRHIHYHEAQISTDLEYQSNGVDVGMHNIDGYELDKEDQLILKTVVDLTDKHEPVFRDIEEVREVLHKHVRDSLLAEINAFQTECSPTMEEMPEKDFQELYEQVKKTPEMSTLSELSLHMLKKLLLTSVHQLKTLPTDK